MLLRALGQPIMEHNQHYGNQPSYISNPSPWMDGGQYAQQNDFAEGDYGGFRNRTSSFQQEPAFGASVYSPYVPRQPNMYPTPLPSTLISQLPYQLPSMNSSPQQSKPMQGHALDSSQTYSPTAISNRAPPHRPNPRRTLTDADRRRMCLYKRDNPSKKQTEIGAVFGVERTTVSKVLGQKEKWLTLEDGGTPSVKKGKKGPDIERALDQWAKNQERNGIILTDESIKKQAMLFAATLGDAENYNFSSSAWLDDFKRKRSTSGFKVRRASRPAADPAKRRQSEASGAALNDSLMAFSMSRTNSVSTTMRSVTRSPYASPSTSPTDNSNTSTITTISSPSHCFHQGNGMAPYSYTSTASARHPSISHALSHAPTIPSSLGSLPQYPPIISSSSASTSQSFHTNHHEPRFSLPHHHYIQHQHQPAPIISTHHHVHLASTTPRILTPMTSDQSLSSHTHNTHHQQHPPITTTSSSAAGANATSAMTATVPTTATAMPPNDHNPNSNNNNTNGCVANRSSSLTTPQPSEEEARNALDTLSRYLQSQPRGTAEYAELEMRLLAKMRGAPPGLRAQMGLDVDDDDVDVDVHVGGGGGGDMDVAMSHGGVNGGGGGGNGSVQQRNGVLGLGMEFVE